LKGWVGYAEAEMDWKIWIHGIFLQLMGEPQRSELFVTFQPIRVILE